MLKKALAVILCAAFTAAFMCGCNGANDTAYSEFPEIVFRYADNQTDDYPSVVAARYFAEQVYEKTNGRIKIEIYNQAQLGTEQEALRQVQFGGIDFARASTAAVAEYCDIFNILLMPYLFGDENHMLRVLNGDVGLQMKQCLIDHGFVGLACYNTGARSFYFVNETKSFNDFSGLNIRTQNNELMQEFVTLLGAQAHPADYNSVLTMLQTGKIDGAENNIPSYNSEQHQNYAGYYFMDKHNFAPEFIIMCQKSMQLLSDDDKKIIEECSKAAQEYEYRLWQEHEQSAMQALIKEGVVFYYPSEEELANVRQLVEPLYEEYYDDYSGVIEKIKAEL